MNRKDREKLASTNSFFANEMKEKRTPEALADALAIKFKNKSNKVSAKIDMIGRDAFIQAINDYGFTQLLAEMEQGLGDYYQSGDAGDGIDYWQALEILDEDVLGDIDVYLMKEEEDEDRANKFFGQSLEKTWEDFAEDDAEKYGIKTIDDAIWDERMRKLQEILNYEDNPISIEEYKAKYQQALADQQKYGDWLKVQTIDVSETKEYSYDEIVRDNLADKIKDGTAHITNARFHGGGHWEYVEYYVTTDNGTKFGPYKAKWEEEFPPTQSEIRDFAEKNIETNKTLGQRTVKRTKTITEYKEEIHTIADMKFQQSMIPIGFVSIEHYKDILAIASHEELEYTGTAFNKENSGFADALGHYIDEDIGRQHWLRWVPKTKIGNFKLDYTTGKWSNKI